MLIQLVLKYFIYNHKRTFQGVITLAVGVMLFVASVGIVSGFSGQAQLLSNLLPKSRELLIEPVNQPALSNETIEKIISLSRTVDPDVMPMRSNYTPAKLSGSQGQFEIFAEIIDYAELANYSGITSIALLENNTIVIGENLAVNTGLFEGSFGQIQIENISISVEVGKVIRRSGWISTQVLIPFQAMGYEHFRSATQLRLVFSDPDQAQRLRLFLHNQVGNITISDQSGTKLFLDASFSEILNLLWILEILFGILAVLSIGYTLTTLVKESVEEIKILRALGFSSSQIFALFYGQSLLIGLLGGLLGMLIGLVSAVGALSFSSAVIDSPYFILTIDLRIVSMIFALSVIISALAGIYPAMLATSIEVREGE